MFRLAFLVTLASAVLFAPAVSAQDAGTDPTGDAAAEEGDAGVDLSPEGIQGMVENAKAWFDENGVDMAINVVKFIVILIVFKILAGILAGAVGKALSASKLSVSDLLKNFATGTTRKIVFLIGLVVALGTVGIDVGPFLAAAGVLGFVVGFALQDTLGNFAAGIMILLYRPYDIGDVVDAGGTVGKVTAMSLVSTTMHTPDNQKVIVPNGSIWGGTITNITAMDTRRVDLTMGIGYEDDIDKAAKVIEEVVTAHELVLKDPAPQIEVANLGDSSVDFVVRPWSKTSDYWTVKFDLTKQLKQRFDKEGISIPFPQRDVHLYNEKA